MNKMAISTILALSMVFACLIAAPAKPKPATKHSAPTAYVCSKCHMQFSASDAKKDHYVDPMDQGKLVPVKTSAKKVR